MVLSGSLIARGVFLPINFLSPPPSALQCRSWKKKIRKSKGPQPYVLILWLVNNKELKTNDVLLHAHAHATQQTGWSCMHACMLHLRATV